jgi:hypothetical protein
VQPRTSQAVPIKVGQTPHGAILISATSGRESIDPLIARPVTDTALSEPPFDADVWVPSGMWAVNRRGDEARLVVVPAQFLGNQDSGTLRRFTSLQFEVYYAPDDETDFTQPTVWQVGNDGATFWAIAEDESEIQRVVMVYTEDGSQWQSVDLGYVSLQDRWEAQVDNLSGQVLYLIQAVDGVGNVTITSNKGAYFEPSGGEVYLPLMVRNYR